MFNNVTLLNKYPKMTTIRIDDNVKNKLNEISVKKFRMTYTDISKNFLLNQILNEYIEHNSISNKD